ncbi:oxidoreductase [Bacillus sp. AGMB 02131]|uniref:Oxidoreductase n=1 Tax=Peribacillus faecalis TaxID=2772559 RepID=A0A927HC58_9BACI|nr:oxidoreductase [Peribacillus faecalis]MBD3109297.1 oxidoreductase [Peribacillus faecalis]
MQKKKALIIGSTGLIGKELRRLLLEDAAYEKVYALVRRPVHTQHPKLAEYVVDFEHLQAAEEFFEADDVFCCLGTTIKKAGSRSAMRKVDVEYPVKVARLAKEKGATHYLVVSAGGANTKSPFAYSRIKGELEEQLKSLSYETLSIFHPSLLLGDREEHRKMEGLANKVVRKIEKFKKIPISSGIAIEGKTVALAMNRIAQENVKGVHVYSSKQIGEIATNL